MYDVKVYDLTTEASAAVQGNESGKQYAYKIIG